MLYLFQKSVENQLEEVKFRLDMSEKQRQVLENETEKLNKVIIDLQDKLKEASKEVIITLIFDNISIKIEMWGKMLI